MSGTLVAERHPAAVTTKRAVTTSPRSVRTSQVFDASSNVAATTRGLELEVAAEVEAVRDVVEVPLDLRLFRVPARPFPLLRELLVEGVAVVEALGVAARAGVAVPEPRAADARTGLVCLHPQPQDVAQPVERVEPGEARAHDDCVEVGYPMGVRVLVAVLMLHAISVADRAGAITSSPPRPANASTRPLGRGARWGVPRRRPPRRGRSFRSCRRR